MNNKFNAKLFFAAFALASLLLIPYEYYWRYVEHWPAGFNSRNTEMWAEWRGEAEKLGSEDIIVMGSSRGHFDINIHLWDSITGRRPVMLAFPGSSPYHMVEDLVANTEFNGLLVMSVAPGLFFTMSDSWGANQGKERVDYYYKRTYAQRFSQWIFKRIDPQFSYLNEELTIKSLINRIPLENRDSVEHPALWPPMVNMDKYRSVRMIPEMETDTALQRQQTDIWHSPDRKNRYVDSVEVIMNHYVNIVSKLKARGGRVVFIRPPVTGEYLKDEPVLYPRQQYWERLLRESGSPGYHYMDHPDTKDMVPPEWSHLNRRDADVYTRTIIDLLKKDQLL